MAEQDVPPANTPAAPPPPPPPDPQAQTAPQNKFRAPAGVTDAEKVKDQLSRQAGVDQPRAAGGGTLFTEPILVVNQKAKLIELTNEYDVFDQNGNQIGAVLEIGQTQLKKAVRLFSRLDQYFTHRLEIRDANGTAVLGLTRPAKIMKSKFVITDGDGAELGTIVQKNVMGKKRFALEAGGNDLATIRAKNWRAWDFHIEDPDGNEVALITKTWEGLGKAMFTTADNYVIEFTAPVAEPLRSMIVTAGLCIDTALKQDAQGFS
jgi:uncharacterized protein YxjI